MRYYWLVTAMIFSTSTLKNDLPHFKTFEQNIPVHNRFKKNQ
jgi:hypothetical protein